MWDNWTTSSFWWRKRKNDLLPDGECLLYANACVTIYLSINRDGWWTNKDVIKQVKERAILIFEWMHPGKLALFMFDNSCNHNSFTEDALLVSQMNMSDSGKQLILRNGSKPDGSVHVMMFVDSNGNVKPKGIRCILQKCNLWVSGLKRQCDSCKTRDSN